jgi:hypothetical protein
LFSDRLPFLSPFQIWFVRVLWICFTADRSPSVIFFFSSASGGAAGRWWIRGRAGTALLADGVEAVWGGKERRPVSVGVRWRPALSCCCCGTHWRPALMSSLAAVVRGSRCWSWVGRERKERWSAERARRRRKVLGAGEEGATDRSGSVREVARLLL